MRYSREVTIILAS